MCRVTFSQSCAWKTSTNPLFLLLHLLLVSLGALFQALCQSPSLRLHGAQPALCLRLLKSHTVGALGELRPQEHVLPLGLLSGHHMRQHIQVRSPVGGVLLRTIKKKTLKLVVHDTPLT